MHGFVQADHIRGVTGLDLPSLINFSMACGHDMDVVTELLSEAGRAFKEVLANRNGEDDEESVSRFQ